MMNVPRPAGFLWALASLAALSGGCSLTAERAHGGWLRTPVGKVYYETAGAGEAVVLIHGGQMDCRIWDEQMALLAPSYRVIRYDVRGYGGSPAPSGVYSQFDDLAALLDRLGVAKAHVVGLSLGGAVAIDFAIAHPDRVKKVVAAAPGLRGFDWSPGPRDWVQPIIEAAQDNDRARLADLWLANPMMQAAAANPAVAPRVRRLVMENLECWLVNSSLEKSLRPPSAKRLAEIKAPILVIVGDRDIPDMQRAAEKIAKEVPAAHKLVISGAGHIVNMERPEEFNRALLDFLGP
jgi:pimeloyl-ACP methyl ester carboxylesterase